MSYDRVRLLFMNRLRSLYNIDHHPLPELSLEDWLEFRVDPPHYLMRADKIQVEAIWREIENRQDGAFVQVVCDRPPGHESGAFVELEDSNGRSINFGEWIVREDGFHVLKVPL